MKSHIFAHPVLILILVFSFATFAQAGDMPRYTIGGDVIHGGSSDFAKAGGDTINLMSTHNDPTNGPGEPTYFGDFEDADGNPNWNGWTHYDVTAPTGSFWTVSNYNQPNPANHAAWCGDISFAACDTSDAPGGYGNSWNEYIEFRQTVPNPGKGSTVSVTATLMHDSEPGYDYTYLSYQYAGQFVANMESWDGTGTVAVSNSVGYLPGEYLDGTDIVVYFRFKSDGGWSDEDCSWPSAGGCQVDDINIHLVNDTFSENFFEDFEHGGDPEDFGIWTRSTPTGVGDFAQIWTGLRDIDPCVDNSSPQVAFIDDGIVVPGTGGSECINWCYGPGGYIVNTTGGLIGSEGHLHNVIESPVMAWPGPKSGTGPDDDGIIIRIGVFRHEDLSADAPGMFFTWNVRSADTDNSAGNGVQDITEQGWHDRSNVYYGGPDYIRAGDDVTDLMNPGRDEIQVQLGVYQLGWVWYWTGNDGYPAPYFDNVTVKIFPYHGPGMSARELDLAQDDFPTRGSIDTGDLGSHSVRFDAANNIALASGIRIIPGDSITVTISPVRSGADFDGDPELHYIINRNPVFDPYRTSGWPAMGSTTGRPAVGSSGQPTTYRWAFDLPDTGFLFPGDVLHYFISATDAIGGVGGTEPQTALMPADTTGFSTSFYDPMGYNSTFVVRALPSIQSDGIGGLKQPDVLFINDFANRGGENKWYTALHDYGLLVGRDYDVYYVNAPSSGVGNGIGGRANSILLEGYTEILYTCGDLSVNTISNGDFNLDPGNDVGTLKAWLDSGNKDMLLTGDDLASDLAQSGAATLDFLENYMGAGLVSFDIRKLIGNQASPLVAATPDNPVFNGTLQSWFAFGGCPGTSTFDAVQVKTGSLRIAEFTDPAGQTGVYPYSAATLNPSAGLLGTSRVISLSYDLMSIYTNPEVPGSTVSARTALLGDCMLYFGIPSIGDPVPVDLPGITFQAGNYPNPFNPSTTIRYSMPNAGHLKLSVYNVRGHLVKTLIDGDRPAGADQTIVWDGSDNLGSSVSSGVYFYEARLESEVKIGKMTLVK